MFSSDTTQVSDGGYQISRSLRFNSADSAYLGRTPASASNRTTFTISFWTKITKFDVRNMLFEVFGAGNDNDYFSIEVSSTNQLGFGGYLTTWRYTNQVFRDPSAWYHIVVAVDTTQATANNRARLYVNGSEVTSFAALGNPTQNSNTAVDSTFPHKIGTGTGGYYNGYMTEYYLIDGQQLTPSSFGETNAQTGVWQPKAYSGSYGTNGFYLNFSDNSNTTAATLGKDYSGNGNNWTPNNFSVTAGAGNDSLVDSPTSYGTDTGVGGTVRGNYCTWNPLGSVLGAGSATNGNLDVACADASTGTAGARGTIAPTSDKWYFEVLVVSGGVYGMIGVSDANKVITSAGWGSLNAWTYYGSSGNKYGNGTDAAYGATYTTGDLIGVAYDSDAGTLTFYKNGTSQGQAFTGLTGKALAPYVGTASGTMTFTLNAGQRPFAYTAPSGYKALCTQNLPTPTIGATTATQAGKYYNAVTYAGTSATNQIANGINMASNGGLVWTKSRSQAGADPVIYDSIRGPGYFLKTDQTVSEIYSSISLVSFDSDGVTFGADTAQGYSNYAPYGNYVAWAWAAGGSGVTNTAGSITSTVSANTTSGFSVATFTTPASGAFTFGHGLGVAPSMVIAKSRSGTLNWVVYHSAIGATKYLTLNSTSEAITLSSVWNDTAPTSTVVSSTAAGLGASNNYVAYCFAEVAGYSKFGSYTGNGSADGAFVYCGFRPAYVMIKLSSAAGDSWQVFDAARDTSNVMSLKLQPNLSNAESSLSAIDFVSNGFKLRDSNSAWNGSGNTYIFACFATAPFKYSLAR